MALPFAVSNLRTLLTLGGCLLLLLGGSYLIAADVMAARREQREARQGNRQPNQGPAGR